MFIQESKINGQIHGKQTLQEYVICMTLYKKFWS